MIFLILTEHGDEGWVPPTDGLNCLQLRPLQATRPSHPLPPITVTIHSSMNLRLMRTLCLSSAPCARRCSPATQLLCTPLTAQAKVHLVWIRLWHLCSALYARTCFLMRLSLDMPVFVLFDTHFLSLVSGNEDGGVGGFYELPYPKTILDWEG